MNGLPPELREFTELLGEVLLAEYDRERVEAQQVDPKGAKPACRAEGIG